MALARIISRSQQCSRELERELLARGYAVEIVSPDAIPDGPVDLELRVEAGAADQLTATVEARNGGRSASLAFVHRLKPPMGDFVRRSPETSETVSFPAQPVSFNAEPGVDGDVELPSENWRASEPARKLETLPDPVDGKRLITLTEKLLVPARELAKHLRRGVSIKFRRSSRLWKDFIASQALRRVASRVAGTVATRVSGRARLQSCRNGCRNIAGFGRRGLLRAVELFSPRSSKPRQKAIASSAGWFGRAAMILAAVVVVAIVLGWSISRGGSASLNDAQAGPGKPAAAPNLNSLKNPEPEPATATVSVPTPASKSDAKPAQISKTPRVHTKSKKSGPATSLGMGDDEVARDTVIYFDKPAPAPPPRDSSRRRESSHQQNADAAPAGTSPI